MNLITHVHQDQPAFTSLDLARNAQVKHAKLIREIDRIRSILTDERCKDIFSRYHYQDARGKRKRGYIITLYGLAFLGWTDKPLIRCKAKYIQAVRKALQRS